MSQMPSCIEPIQPLPAIFGICCPFFTGIHHLDAVDQVCRYCGNVHLHNDMLTWMTEKSWPQVPANASSNPMLQVNTVYSQRYLQSASILQLLSVRTSTTGLIAAAEAVLKQHGRDARSRKGDYHATVAEHRKFSHHDMKLLEEDTFTCPCCLKTGCRVTTDGNRQTVCYNPPCTNCGRCERCLNPDSYYSLGASPSEDLYVAEAEADIKLEAMYPEKNKTQREEPQMCGDADHKVLRNQSHVESKTKCVTGMVAAVCTHYFMLACVAMKVRAGLLVAAYIETTAMRHH